MELITSFCCVFFFAILYFVLEGHREAVMYDMMNRAQSFVELHHLFLIQRVCVLVSLAILSFLLAGWKSLVFDYSLILLFTPAHNSAYYTMRNKLDPNVYPKRWKDDSKTSTAKMEFGFKYRIAMAIVGTISFFVFLNLIK